MYNDKTNSKSYSQKTPLNFSVNTIILQIESNFKNLRSLV